MTQSGQRIRSKLASQPCPKDIDSGQNSRLMTASANVLLNLNETITK